jgi:hypothetical protein
MIMGRVENRRIAGEILSSDAAVLSTSTPLLRWAKILLFEGVHVAVIDDAAEEVVLTTNG